MRLRKLAQHLLNMLTAKECRCSECTILQYLYRWEYEMRRVFSFLVSLMVVAGLGCPAFAALSGSNTFDTNYMYLYSASGQYGSVLSLTNDFTNWSIVDETPYLISVTGIDLPGDTSDGYLGAVAGAGLGAISFDFAGTSGDDEYYVEVLYLDNGSVGSIAAGLWGDTFVFNDYQSFVDSGVVPEAFSSQVLASATPIPGAIWLLGSGLVGMLGIRRRFFK